MSLKVNFIGRLGVDAETVTTQSAPFVTMRAAVADRVAGENTTIWVTINADYERYKKMAPFLSKGSVISVTGSLRCSQYHTKAGTTGIDYKVSADSIEFLNLGKKPTVDTKAATVETNNMPEMTTGGLRTPATNIPTDDVINSPFEAATASASIGDDLPF